MNDLATFQGVLASYVPNWRAAAIVESVAGSGIGYQGEIALVLAPDRLVALTPAQAGITIYFDSFIRVREIEFRGLVIERDGVLVALNETSGLEIVYRGAGGDFERTIRFLTRSANNARLLVEAITSTVTGYFDDRERPGNFIIYKNK